MRLYILAAIAFLLPAVGPSQAAVQYAPELNQHHATETGPREGIELARFQRRGWSGRGFRTPPRTFRPRPPRIVRPPKINRPVIRPPVAKALPRVPKKVVPRSRIVTPKVVSGLGNARGILVRGGVRQKGLRPSADRRKPVRLARGLARISKAQSGRELSNRALQRRKPASALKRPGVRVASINRKAMAQSLIRTKAEAKRRKADVLMKRQIDADKRKRREAAVRRNQLDRLRKSKKQKEQSGNRTTLTVLAISRANLRSSLASLPRTITPKKLNLKGANDNRRAGVKGGGGGTGAGGSGNGGDGKSGGPPQRPTLTKIFNKTSTVKVGTKSTAVEKKINSFGKNKKANNDNKNLKFGKNDLVYGPSAGGRLQRLVNRAGGKTLNEELRGRTSTNSIEKESLDLLRNAAKSGRQVHFDLTNMKDVGSILRNKGNYADKITSVELRYLRDNWGKFKVKPKFYKGGIEVAPPWKAN